MKTINNLNINHLTFRNSTESYNSGKLYNKRLGIRLDETVNNQLRAISDDIGISVVEIIRQIVTRITDSCEDIINENDY